ncbi:MAG: phytoene synthase CrtB [Oceanicaulis sp. HLUCCA04]|nr:MAG: phytoene synthase CrtB [Oceanicaulis sp. HLUCCA04]
MTWVRVRGKDTPASLQWQAKTPRHLLNAHVFHETFKAMTADLPPDTHQDTLADTVRREDPARYMAALFAPPDTRARLLALYAFNAEIARIPRSVSEPVIGEMRLAWARDAAADIFADPPRVRRHPVYEALAGLKDVAGAPAQDALATLIEARNADLGEGAFPDAAERERYIELTAVTVMMMAARLCAPGWQADEDGKAALTAAGRLWGYAGLLHDFARLCAAGRPPVTQSELVQSGASLEALRRGFQPDKAHMAREGLIEAARAAAMQLDASRSALPPEIFPAVGYATLARGQFKTAARRPDPYAYAPAENLLGAQLRLLWASLTGRI